MDQITEALFHVLPLYSREAWEIEVKIIMEDNDISNPHEAGMVALIENLIDLERI